MRSKTFHVLDEMPSRILLQARVWPAVAAPTLMKKDDPVSIWIEEAAIVWFSRATRPTVHEYNRSTDRIPAFLVIDLMEPRYAKMAGQARFDRGINGSQFPCHALSLRMLSP